MVQELKILYKARKYNEYISYYVLRHYEKFSCSLDVSNAPFHYGRHYFGLSICTPPDYFNSFFVFFGL